MVRWAAAHSLSFPVCECAGKLATQGGRQRCASAPARPLPIRTSCTANRSATLQLQLTHPPHHSLNYRPVIGRHSDTQPMHQSTGNPLASTTPSATHPATHCAHPLHHPPVQRYFISSNSPSGGTKETTFSALKRPRLTQGWNVTSCTTQRSKEPAHSGGRQQAVSGNRSANSKVK